MAGALGLEPRYTAPKTVVLPLNDTPLLELSCLSSDDPVGMAVADPQFQG